MVRIVGLSVLYALMGLSPTHAAPADLLIEINNPDPATSIDFGNSVASTPDGKILVGAPRDGETGVGGSVYLLDGETGETLLTLTKPVPNEFGLDAFGGAVASTPDGDILVGAWGDNTGASSAGSAYLFDGQSGALLLTLNNPSPEDNDYFGISMAATPAGDILVGAYEDNTDIEGAGAAYLFDGQTGDLLLTLNNPDPGPFNSDFFGFSVAITPVGNIVVGAWADDLVGDPAVANAGTVYLFDGQSGVLLRTLSNPDPDNLDHFGISLDVTPGGDIVVGAEGDHDGAGGVYLFDGETGDVLLALENPEPNSDPLISPDLFGRAVSTTAEGNILVGAHAHDTDTDVVVGAAYLFDGQTGELLLTFDNPTPNSFDAFGIAVATTPDGNAIVGAHRDDTGAVNAGSVYLFEEFAECFLFAGIVPVDQQFEHPLADVEDIQYVIQKGNLIWPVLETDIPVLRVPDRPRFDGVTFRMQVWMNNPDVFPNDPFQASNALEWTVGAGAPTSIGSNGYISFYGGPANLGEVIDLGFDVIGM